MFDFGSVTLSRDAMNAINRAVKQYLSFDGKTEIKKIVDEELKKKSNDEKNGLTTTKARMIEKADATYGTQYLLGHRQSSTNDNVLDRMKNKINYGPNPNTVSQNNGDYNNVSY